MCLDDVLSAQPVFASLFQIDVDVALRVDDRGHANGTDPVGGVRQELR
jgi:hypothetical protein